MSQQPKKIKTFTLDEVKDRFLGLPGTPEREQYEHELRMDIIGAMIKKVRLEHRLTQEELGRLVGVQKAQISKLENSANSATIDTIQRVFQALGAELRLVVTVGERTLAVG